MASGHVNRINRPNTWLHRPTLQREDSPCQPGAVHTWPIASFAATQHSSRFRGKADINPGGSQNRIYEYAPSNISA
jgi:hypothetical protein